MIPLRLRGPFNAECAIEVVIAPPGLFLLIVREHLKDEIEVCSQNVFDKPNGAFTGEISAEQLADSKIGWALCGHSERRVILGEGDDVSLRGYCQKERTGKRQCRVTGRE